MHKKWSLPFRISSVNVSKYAGNSGFGHIYWKNLEWKTSFFVQCPCISESCAVLKKKKNYFQFVMPQKVLWKPMVFKLNFLSSRIGVGKLKYTPKCHFQTRKIFQKLLKIPGSLPPAIGSKGVTEIMWTKRESLFHPAFQL